MAPEKLTLTKSAAFLWQKMNGMVQFVTSLPTFIEFLLSTAWKSIMLLHFFLMSTETVVHVGWSTAFPFSLQLKYNQ